MILDYVDNLELSDNDRDKFHNELRSLSYLSVGLSYLAHQVRSVEKEVLERLPESSSHFIYGDAPDLEGVPQDLVACSFHWYSVSAYNYVLLVGWLTQGRTYDLAKQYVESVIPEVYGWRNKVGAHFARAYPREGRHADSEADLSWSVLFPIAFEGEAFFTDPLRVTLSSKEPRNPPPPGVAGWRWRLLMNSGRRTVKSIQGMKWSLTQVHQRLSSRYGFPRPGG